MDIKNELEMSNNCGNYILIKVNNSFNHDNIEGRIQTEIFQTYQEAYDTMKNEVIEYLSIHDKGYKGYLNNVLAHCEYTNVYLGEWSAREHSDYGTNNKYWKIVYVSSDPNSNWQKNETNKLKFNK